MNACKSVGTHAMKFVNTLGAIPGVGTAIGAARIPIAIVLFIISGLGWLLSGCGKWDGCKGFNKKCATLVKKSVGQICIGFVELFPGLGAYLHWKLNNEIDKSQGYGRSNPPFLRTYFVESCCDPLNFQQV